MLYTILWFILVASLYFIEKKVDLVIPTIVISIGVLSDIAGNLRRIADAFQDEDEKALGA